MAFWHESYVRALIGPAVVLSVALLTSEAVAQPAKPNVVLILTDDAGYSDFGFSAALNNVAFQGSTPNIDALAQQSVVARQGYASPVCSPTRVGLMTGRFQQRLGAERVLGNDLSETWGLTGNETTIADRMKSLGYTTGMVGKWHIGYVNGVNRPNDAGFDEFFGFLSGNRRYYGESGPSNIMLRNTTNVEAQWRTQGDSSLYDPTRGRYVTDAFGEEATAFINNHANDANPFFLYLPVSAPHDPYESKQQDYDAFPGITDVTQRTTAAMIKALDRSVGMVTSALAANGIDDNTMILFINDNGGAGQGNNKPFRDFKNTAFEGGIRVPFMIKAPGLAPGTYDSPVNIYDVTPTVVAAAGGTVPAGQTDGVNLLPFLSGADTSAPHDALYFRSGLAWAIRKGDWKLGRMSPSLNASIVLVNVATNPAENFNQYNLQPAVVDDLTKDFTRWEATMTKPAYGSVGADDRNKFDQFVFRVDQATSANFSDANMWTEGGAPAHNVTLGIEDAYANAILEFGVKQGGDYTASNNMLRQSGLTFMANQLRFSGSFSGAANRSATINGNAMVLVKNLAGQGPQIQFTATSTNANGFAFTVANQLQLLDNLEITGNGTQAFAITGAIKDFDAPRNVLKTGTSVVTLGGPNTFHGTLSVNAGRIRLDGAAAAINGAASIAVANGATFEVNDGSINTSTINVAPGGKLIFNPAQLTATDLQTGVVNQGSVALGGATPGTVNMTGSFLQSSGALTIRIGKQGATNLFDKLQVAGPAELGGLLDLDLVNLGSGNFTPAPGATFQILSATGGITGMFSATDLPLTANGLGWQVLTTASSVTLKTLLAADFDANGVVNGLDLLKWKAGFGITSGATFMQGDANRDGRVDGEDYFAWQRSLGLSAATFPVSGAVPEPAAAALLLLAAAALPGARRRLRSAG